MDYLQNNVEEAVAAFNAISEEIVATGVEVEEGTKPRLLANKIPQVYEAGKKAEYDEFWDTFQKSGNRAHYAQAFAFTGWNDTIYNPKYPIVVKHAEGIGNMLRWNVEITNTKVSISVTNGSMNQAFSNAQSLKTIPSLVVNGVTNFNNAFQNCIKLEELNLSGVIDINGFDIHWSTNLSAESIDSIVRALSPNTTGLTVTLPADAYLTHATTYGAPNTAVLWESKSNWTINELAV